MNSPDRRRLWVVVLVAVIAAGLLSRTVHTGLALVDKYPGDALYAAMVYAGLRVLGVRQRVALIAMGIMVAIECFQLTGIPARMYSMDEPLVVRAAGRLLGTEFSFFDLLAYAVGIGLIHRVGPR